MKNYFEYEVVVVEEDNIETYHGITYGDSYNEALDHLMDFYDTEAITSVKMECLDCEGCIILSKECLAEMREDINKYN